MNEGSYPDVMSEVRRDAENRYGGQAIEGQQRTATIGGETGILPIAQPPKSISITPLNHGFLVAVGCQSFAIESVDALLHRLNVYLKDPAATEKKWLAGEWKW